MSTLLFSNSELRVATATLAALAAIVPAYYLFRNEGFLKSASTPHLKTFRKYLKAYSSLRPASLSANATNDFTHAVLPLSLKIPERDLEDFQQHAHIIFSLFASFQMIPVKTPDDDGVHFSKETNTVIAHCKMGGKVNSENEKGKLLIDAGYDEWWTENVLVVRLSEDGTRVEEVKEFVDSAKAAELQQRLSGVLSN
ncbi:hypothetical protein DM02DRAFT_604743 [Periconia macrospinosa]|uniref:Uncharacterized protein n=1 Tax=Periconia macrospinosa TaxID=97972 RepID=A0A2V1D484_9PLEO|nr:hypothetical protein DM02DRAFT_604743 [Periconia macrospinosa]